MYINKYYVREDLETAILTEVDARSFNVYLYCFDKLKQEWKDVFPNTRMCLFYDESGDIVAMRTNKKVVDK